jgi:hypothetical protein
MPVVLIERVEFEGDNYYIPLRELSNVAPHIKELGSITFFILEIRNEKNQLIKKVKILKEMRSTISQYYDSVYKQWTTCIRFHPYRAVELNIGKNYHVAILITEHNGKPLFPFEIKPLGPNAEEIVKNFEKIETILFSSSLTQPSLQEAIRYLLEASSYLKDGEIENARTSLRKSLDTLRSKRFLSKIKVTPGQETDDFPERLKGLLSKIKSFVDYGGPHPGPSPKGTTEMVLNMTAEFIRCIARNVDEKVITIQENKEG